MQQKPADGLDADRGGSGIDDLICASKSLWLLVEWAVSDGRPLGGYFTNSPGDDGDWSGVVREKMDGSRQIQMYFEGRTKRTLKSWLWGVKGREESRTPLGIFFLEQVKGGDEHLKVEMPRR